MKRYKVTVNGKVIEVDEGTTLYDLSLMQERYQEDIVLANVNGRLNELFKPITEDSTVEFINTSNSAGYLTYKRSVSLLMLKAVNDVIDKKHIYKVVVMYSISNGYYCELESDTMTLTDEFIDQVKERMHYLVEKGTPINKKVISTAEAADKFGYYRMYDKEKLFRYRRNSKTNLYSIGNFEDYFYGYMVHDTSVLKYFDLFLYEDGFMLQMPSKFNPKTVAPFIAQKKLFDILHESKDWGITLGTSTVGALNDTIVNGDINNMILIQEALQEKKIASLSDDIVKQKKKIILIAGPSSSGKTTFSHRLSIQLKVHGLNPHPIAVDNYFVDRINSPIDEFGNYDFESLGSIDLEQFNRDMEALLAGKVVEMPVYNFIKGEREYKGDYLQLGDNDIMVIEGIHCLNETLTASLPKSSKYKIYISALSQINIDEHNRIPTTDGRLIRRIIRDARTRGSSAAETIARWGSVRKGESENIFPYQEEADAMFNSALIYEMCILKQYAEPLLFAIQDNCPEYQEAKRLLKFMDYFLGVSSEFIPQNSILREFIGESCFHV